MEDIGDCHLAGHRVQHLCRDSDLRVLPLCEADLRVEVQHCPDFDWSPKEDVVHVKNRRPGLAKNKRVCPGELKGLSHDEPSVDLVVDVPVVRLAHDQVLQVGVLKPSRVFRLHSRLKFIFDIVLVIAVWATLNEKPRWSTVLMKMLWMMSCSSRVGGTCQKFPIFILIADNIIRPLFPVGGETSSKYLDFASSPTLYGDGGHNSEMCGQNKVNLESFVTLKSESAFMEILLENGDLYADVSVKSPPARLSLGNLGWGGGGMGI